MSNVSNPAYESRYLSQQSHASSLQGGIEANHMNRAADTYYINLLQPVELVTPVEDDGLVLPVGSVGTVVYKYVGAYDYEVEFGEPFHRVVYVEGRWIAPLRDRRW